jgi:hypothetical protein
VPLVEWPLTLGVPDTVTTVGLAAPATVGPRAAVSALLPPRLRLLLLRDEDDIAVEGDTLMTLSTRAGVLTSKLNPSGAYSAGVARVALVVAAAAAFSAAMVLLGEPVAGLMTAEEE